MEQIDVLFRKKNLFQLKAIVPKAAPLPLVTIWRREEGDNGFEEAKLESIRLDRKEVFKMAMSCDEVASDEIIKYISACK
jgi:hypothetical protein